MARFRCFDVENAGLSFVRAKRFEEKPRGTFERELPCHRCVGPTQVGTSDPTINTERKRSTSPSQFVQSDVRRLGLINKLP